MPHAMDDATWYRPMACILGHRAVTWQACSCNNILCQPMQLRWMLWAMCHGSEGADEVGIDLGGEVGQDEFDWVMQVRHIKFLYFLILW